MIHWFYHLSKGRQIGVSTIAAHLIFLLVLIAQHGITSPFLKKRRPIAVNTVRIIPNPTRTANPVVSKSLPTNGKATVAKGTVSVSKQVAAVTPLASNPVQSKEAKKGETKKTEAKKVAAKSVGQKKVATQKQATLLKEIEHNLTVIEATPSVKKVELQIPALRKPEEFFEEISATPIQQISAFLQETLRLPEIGQVRVRLSIDRFGKLQSVEVLDSKSEKNAEFLKKQLPELQFPCLNEIVSLTIVFSNEL